MNKYSNVDEYIASFPPKIQAKLNTIRQIINEVAPEAQEKISYGMPYYSLRGRLVYFAAFQDHVSLFPMRSGIAAFESELSDYKTSVGTIQFPLDKPLPLPLIRQIIAFRVKENQRPKK